jgi:hypothetical protein
MKAVLEDLGSTRGCGQYINMKAVHLQYKSMKIVQQYEGNTTV